MICLKTPEGNFCLFYATASHFLVRGEGEGGRGDFEEKNDKVDMERGSREVKKMLFWEKPPHWMAPMWKFWKKSVYLIHKP